MTRTVTLVAALAALLAGPALAAPHAAPRRTALETRIDRALSPSDNQGFQQLVDVQTRRSTMAIIATDALYGGLAGLAVGAGIALIEGGNNWGRDLSVGAGVGLLAGAVFGAVDAASAPDRIAAADSQLKDREGRRSGPALGYGMRF